MSTRRFYHVGLDQEEQGIGCGRTPERHRANADRHVLEINGGKVRLGFKGDPDVPVHRLEVWERIRGNGRPDSPTRGLAAPVA